MYKRILCFILCAFFFPALRCAAAADISLPQSRLMINGAYTASDVPPQSRPSGVYLPLRVVVETLGGEVFWDESARSVTGSLGGQALLLADGRCYLDGVLVDASYFFSGGRTLVSTPYFTQLGMTSHWDAENQTAIAEYQPASTAPVMFDLGFGMLETPAGEPFIYPRSGFISLPEADGSHPVVFLLHGDHAAGDMRNTRNDAGFAYLLQELAEAGYAAVSLNVNMQYSALGGEPSDYTRLTQLLNEHLVALAAANAGEPAPYPYDLTGRLDLSQTALIGHGLSGQGSFFAAQEMQAPDTRVAALIAIAPEALLSKTPLPDIPTAVIAARQEENAANAYGETVYRLLAAAPNRQSAAILTGLADITPGAFNAALPLGETSALISGSLSDEMHHAFLTRYTLDFLAYSLRGEPAALTGETIAPDDLYGMSAVTSAFLPLGFGG